jgi:hypothetical protein
MAWEGLLKNTLKWPFSIQNILEFVQKWIEKLLSKWQKKMFVKFPYSPPGFSKTWTPVREFYRKFFYHFERSFSLKSIEDQLLIYTTYKLISYDEVFLFISERTRVYFVWKKVILGYFSISLPKSFYNIPDQFFHDFIALTSVQERIDGGGMGHNAPRCHAPIAPLWFECLGTPLTQCIV